MSDTHRVDDRIAEPRPWWGWLVAGAGWALLFGAVATLFGQCESKTTTRCVLDGAPGLHCAPSQIKGGR